MASRRPVKKKAALKRKRPKASTPPSQKEKKSPAKKRAEVEKQREDWVRDEKSEAAEEARGPGRPTEYTRIDLALVEKLSRIGSTNEQMAAFFDVSISIWYVWQNEHVEFLEAIKKGKAEADDLVEHALFQRAIGFAHPEDKIFYDTQVGRVVVQPTIKRYPADTGAAFIWLQNRRPEKWKHRNEAAAPSPESLQDKLTKLADALQAAHG